MAADKTPDQEPSIEEILASIRQIISDDEDKDSDAPATADEPEPVFGSSFPKEPEYLPPEDDQDDEDVLELTPEMEEPASFMPPAEIDIDLQDQPEAEPEETAAAPPREEISSAPVQAQNVDNTPPPAPKQPESAMPRHSSPDAGTSEILTESARTATLSSMAKLAGNMPITRHREYGNVTLEDLVREMLHPMLKDWMSDNLPPMVERVVQKELEKLARQAQDV